MAASGSSFNPTPLAHADNLGEGPPEGLLLQNVTILPYSFTPQSLLPFHLKGSTFLDSMTVRKNTTNYDGEVLAVCEATMQLLAASPPTAKIVFIDSLAAVFARSSNTPTDCLNTNPCLTERVALKL
ncbi:hypothetical protein TNCV_3901301 [Trichonephila clavipes]|nr:hypothetical protein TNCV_3901301 [Trichonephila clavipes]